MRKESKENLHKEHRKRMRERYLISGIDSFSTHNIVEFMLFNVIPRKDTNEIAHNLLNYYGSFANILDADYYDLIQREGIGEYVATFIKLLPDLFRIYSLDKASMGTVYDKVDKIAEFLISYYTAVTKEIIVVILLNNKNAMIDCVKIHEGSVSSGFVNPDMIAEIVFTRKASNFILAHNHPNGDPQPSNEDILTTRMINNAFSMFNIKMLEHYIIAGTRYTTIGNM